MKERLKRKQLNPIRLATVVALKVRRSLPVAYTTNPHLQILRAVVVSYAVFVMYAFTLFKRSPNSLFDYHPMLPQSSTPILAYLYISVLVIISLGVLLSIHLPHLFPVMIGTMFLIVKDAGDSIGLRYGSILTTVPFTLFRLTHTAIIHQDWVI